MNWASFPSINPQKSETSFSTRQKKKQHIGTFFSFFYKPHTHTHTTHQEMNWTWYTIPWNDHPQLKLNDIHLIYHAINNIVEDARIQPQTTTAAVQYTRKILENTNNLQKKKVTIIAITSLWIASKVHEANPINLHYLALMAPDPTQPQAIIQAEIQILNSLQWHVTQPTPIHFIYQYAKKFKLTPPMQQLATYFAETTYIHSPQPVAPPITAFAACLLVMKKFNNNTRRHKTNSTYTQFKKEIQQAKTEIEKTIRHLPNDPLAKKYTAREQ